MTKLEIDITEKVIRIECSSCDKTFVESFDNLGVKGSIVCPNPDCGHEYFITVKSQ